MRRIDADALRAKFQAILDRGDMFCEYDIIGMLDKAPTVEPEKVCVGKVTFDKDDLEEIVQTRIIDKIQSGELVVKEAGEWIPVSERLPEDMQRVLIWFEYYRYGDYCCMYQTYGFGYVCDGK